MSNVISFVQRKALKEIAEHFDIDFEVLKKEGVTVVEDYEIIDNGDIEAIVEEDF